LVLAGSNRHPSEEVTGMETMRTLVDEFEQTARSIGEAGLDEASWTHLRPRVIDLIQRGNRTVAPSAKTNRDRWTAIQWDGTDAPVLLARAFSKVHRRLAAALHGVAHADEGPVAA
jgi:hypothetical protein